MNATFAKTVALVTLFCGGANTASADPTQQLFWLTGQIRGQMAAVEAQARATFRGTGAGDCVFDTLEDLCRDLDRLEGELSRPIDSRGALRRLGRLAERIDARACDLADAVEREAANLRPRFAGRPVIGDPRLDPRFDPRLDPRFGGGFDPRRAGGVQVSLGGGRIVIGTGGPAFGGPIGYGVGYGPSFGNGPSIGHGASCGVSDPQINALRQQVGRLHRLTSELARVLSC